ncbi:MAG TPA: right-handed parallel beta-helix repeat-containing protein [Phycisphaerales bacterium]|nr:right-handed parallel beta-helix repeat-containing protein [Phycisphaerales bacterium]
MKVAARTSMSVVGGVAVFFAAASVSVAGDLNPPAGPVLPTMKTLVEVEPRMPIGQATTPGDANNVFIITSSGSYYLTGDVTIPLTKAGIQIGADNVTLDLNGFAIIGPGAGVAATAIYAPGAARGITVKNGTIRSCAHGVLLNNATLAMVSMVTVANCSNSGVLVGSAGIVDRCIAVSCGAVGISAGNGSVITGCAAQSCTNGGILAAGPGVAVTGCSATQNTGPGFLVLSNGATLTDCIAVSNGSDGFQIGSSTLIRGCSAVSNGNGGTGSGIHATGSDNRIEGNNCTANDRGIEIDSGGNFVTRNTCSGNTTSNWDVAASNIILVVAGATSAGFNGNVGGAGPGSTDPNANFSY